MKTVIIGNSGSGKTWLAAKLAGANVQTVFHLDDFFWEPGGFNQKRSHEEIQQIVADAKKQNSWIVEGVFGELAQMFLGEADLLIWLDMDWDVCRERLLQRGSDSRKHMGRKQSEAGLRELVEWASQYDERGGLNSRRGHQGIFEVFWGRKIHVCSEEEANAIEYV